MSSTIQTMTNSETTDEKTIVNVDLVYQNVMFTEMQLAILFIL